MFLFLPHSQPGDQAAVPLQYVAGNLCVRFAVEGTPRWFLIDTGSPFSAIGLNIIPGKGVLVDSPTPEVPAKMPSKTLPHLRLGNVWLKDQRFYEHDSWFQIGQYFPQLRGRVSGVLGSDALSKVKLAIDFQRQRAWISDSMPKEFGTPEDFRKLASLTLQVGESPTMNIQLSSERIRVLLDLGAFPTSLPANLLGRVKTHIQSKYQRSVVGVTATRAGEVDLADQINIGSVAWKSPFFFVYDQSLPVQPCLGVSFFFPLRRVFFDFTGKRVFVPASVKSVSFLDLWMNPFGVFAEKDGLHYLDKGFLSWNSIRAVLGLKINSLNGWKSYSAFDHPKFDLAKFDYNATVAYRKGGRIVDQPFPFMTIAP